MTIFLGTMIFLLTIGICAYFRFPRPIWISILTVLLIVLSISAATWHARFWLVVAWTLFISVSVIISATPLRRKLLIQPIFHLFRKLLPPIGETERIAIEAGDTWWDADLFSGNPSWKKLRAMEMPKLTKEEQSF